MSTGNPPPGSTPPGWYPDQQGNLRWFDGTRWTDDVPAAGPTSGPPAGPPSGPPAGPPAGAPPGYGAGYPPSGMPPTKPKSNSTLYVILGVVAIVVIAGVLALVLVLNSGGDDSTKASDDSSSPSSSSDSSSDPAPTTASGADPADTVNGFFAAIKGQDCDTAESLVTPEYIQENGQCSIEEGDEETLAGLKVDVGEADISGDKATVPVTETITLSGSPETDASVFDLELRDGSWLINDIADSSSSGTTGAPSGVPTN